MAYSDIQNKVGQIQMANRILIAQAMNPNKTPETDLEGFQEQGGYAPEEGDIPLRDVEKDTPVEGTLTERRKLLPDYKGNRKFPKVKRKKPPSDADIQTKGNMKGQPKPEDIFGEDYEGGPTYLNTLLQIGGAAGSMIPFMGGNILKMLIGGPNAMAMHFDDTGLGDGGFISTDKPHIYINRGAEAYIRMPDGDFRFDGFYDPSRHGNAFPGLGLVQRNDGMKIAKLPHTPPTEKIVLPNGKLMDSPLRFKTDQERIRFMEDFSRGYGRYS